MTGVFELVQKHEGWRAYIYCDACGKELRKVLAEEGTWTCADTCDGGNLTIGYGTNLSDGITLAEGAALLRKRLAAAAGDLAQFGWLYKLNDVQVAGIVDMRYALGATGFRAFSRMLDALAAGNLPLAADEMMRSKWARVQEPARAREDRDLLVKGVWP